MLRRWGLYCGVVAALALCSLVPVLGGLDQEPKGGFSVMTYNIWDLGRRRPAVQDVAAGIMGAGVPDILLLQEVRGEAASGVKP